jgi:hypothetical protein
MPTEIATTDSEHAPIGHEIAVTRSAHAGVGLIRILSCDVKPPHRFLEAATNANMILDLAQQELVYGHSHNSIKFSGYPTEGITQSYIRDGSAVDNVSGISMVFKRPPTTFGGDEENEWDRGPTTWKELIDLSQDFEKCRRESEKVQSQASWEAGTFRPRKQVTGAENESRGKRISTGDGSNTLKPKRLVIKSPGTKVEEGGTAEPMTEERMAFRAQREPWRAKLRESKASQGLER